MTRTVILVPRREDHGPRDRTWAWVKRWWQTNLPRLTIYEGHHNDGLFNRSAAVNRAAALADSERRWDVAVLIDADVICDPAQVREAIDYAVDHPDRLVLPFSRRHNLNPFGSARIMAGDTGSWRRYIAKTYNDMCSSCVMVPRPLWDAVGGFDEAFRGWGFEDTAFAIACETFGGSSLHKIDGELWHLYHPTAPEGKRSTPSYQSNRARREAYSAALGDPDAIRRLQAGDDGATVPSVRPNENIPRIIHRTVPAVTSDEVEAWWTRMADLHPDWTLMTHRDPLDPDEWPMTSPGWKRCTTGAQLAGLIRLEALYRWGGIYVDSDVEPYRSMEPLLPLRAFAAWEDAKVVPDAVIGAEPEHPAIAECIRLALKRLRAGAWESGPGVTTAVFPGRPDVLLLPPGSFYPYHYREKHRRDENHKRDQPWSFGAHHWAGSWLPAK